MMKFMFLPQRDIINLKMDPHLSFAYELHTDVGDRAIACKINRKYTVECQVRKWAVDRDCSKS